MPNRLSPPDIELTYQNMKPTLEQKALREESDITSVPK